MRIVTAASILGLLTLPVSAQIGNPGGIDPATPQSAPGVPAPRYSNTQDKLFAQLVAEGGAAEVEFGKMAAAKAAATGVKEFGRKMVEDHGKSNELLAQIAKDAGIPLSVQPDPEHRKMQAELERESGRDFDRAYLRGQLIDHQKAIVLLQYVIGQGQNADLQKFAADALPTVLVHLEIARNLLMELNGSAADNSHGGGLPPARATNEQKRERTSPK